MRFNTYINNLKAFEWKLNIQQAYVFSFLYELPSWAEKVILKNEVYYFAARQKAIKEIPLLTDKPDTMYRYYKQLEEKELVKFKKIDGKDCVLITKKGKEWNAAKSEQSEKNPSKFGKSSENDSEKNPTYYDTIEDNDTIDNNISPLKKFKEKDNQSFYDLRKKFEAITGKTVTKSMSNFAENDFYKLTEDEREYLISNIENYYKTAAPDYAYKTLQSYINKAQKGTTIKTTTASTFIYKIAGTTLNHSDKKRFERDRKNFENHIEIIQA